jgi:hypothetical protein
MLVITRFAQGAGGAMITAVSAGLALLPTARTARPAPAAPAPRTPGSQLPAADQPGKEEGAAVRLCAEQWHILPDGDGAIPSLET